jgi:hypothetical protein
MVFMETGEGRINTGRKRNDGAKVMSNRETEERRKKL